MLDLNVKYLQGQIINIDDITNSLELIFNCSKMIISSGWLVQVTCLKCLPLQTTSLLFKLQCFWLISDQQNVTVVGMRLIKNIIVVTDWQAEKGRTDWLTLSW